MAKSRKRRSAAQVRAFKKMRAALARKLGSSVRRTVKRARRAVRRRRNTSTSPGVPTVARRSRRRRSTSRRSSSRRRGGFVSVGGLNKGVVGSAVVTAAGFAAVNMALDKLSTPNAAGKALLPASLSTGAPRIAAKAGLSIAASLVAKKLKQPTIAKGLLVGGLVSCVLDVVSIATAKASGLKGMYDWNNNGQQLGEDPQPQLSGHSIGMGAYAQGRGDPAIAADYAAA